MQEATILHGCLTNPFARQLMGPGVRTVQVRRVVPATLAVLNALTPGTKSLSAGRECVSQQ